VFAKMATVMDYYVGGRGNGRLTNYIIDDDGQCQESGRDQGHTQDGIEHLVETALTIWHFTGNTSVFTMSNCRLRFFLSFSFLAFLLILSSSLCGSGA
jgi:hypothetical protein